MTDRSNGVSLEDIRFMGRLESSVPGSRSDNFVEENYPKSICQSSLFTRPLPSGNRVYFVLLQFVFLNIVGG